MDDLTFYVTAVIVPVLFVLIGAGTRLIIKRKVEWELLYFGIELVLAGMAAAIIHLITPHDEPPPTPQAKNALLTTPSIADILVSFTNPSHWSYAQRAGWAVFVLLMALVTLLVLHTIFEMQSEPLPKRTKVWKVIFLAFIADLIGGGAMVYMERLLR